VTPFISLFRDPILGGVLPEVSILMQALGIALTSLALGLMVFIWAEKRIIFRL
jgi:ABC-type polysaccharide/polyol phosphate export permease